MSKLYIAVYKPHTGNYFHWALYLKGKPSKVFEVTGEHPRFQRNVIETKPESTGRHIENIRIGEVNDTDMRQFLTIMSAQNIDNVTTGWDCQDYVLEAMDTLVEECVIDDEDESFVKGKKKAMKKYYGQQ